MVDSYYKIPYQVKGFECDLQGDIKFPTLMNHLIDLSGEHWDKTMQELGHSTIDNDKLTWILIRYQAQIKQLPRKNERIYLVTEYRTFDKLFAYRHFDVLNEAGDIMVHLESVFALMDVETRRMARMQEEYFEGFDLKEPKSNRIKRYPDIQKLDEAAGIKQRDYYVRYYDIDSNHHVNNTLYLDWAIDVLGAEFLTKHRMIFAAIKFDKEVFYEDYVLSRASLSTSEGGHIVSAHRIETEGKLNAELEFHWLPNE